MGRPRTRDGDSLRYELTIARTRLDNAERVLRDVLHRHATNPLEWQNAALQALLDMSEAQRAVTEAERIRHEASPKRKAAIERERRKRERRNGNE
jgi:hypothetical protein